MKVRLSLICERGSFLAYISGDARGQHLAVCDNIIKSRFSGTSQSTAIRKERRVESKW